MNDTVQESRKYQGRASRGDGPARLVMVAGCLRQTARDSGLEAAWTTCVVIAYMMDYDCIGRYISSPRHRDHAA
jgi:tRNA A37 methylthiotransferase MiaB